jgi:hypothetical protein
MNDWEDENRGPCGIIYGRWIPRDPNYALNKAQKEAEAKVKAAPKKPPVPTEDRIDRVHRNQRSASAETVIGFTGIGDQLRAESVIGLDRNTQILV